MCGIAGLFAPDGPDPTVLERMNDCQTHRGPDEGGVYLNGQVGLAHRRLAIIDPETGTQPLFNEDNSIAVVFNGEIYNHRRLRSTLESNGHTFVTDADTEVIAHGYEEWGDAVVSKLDGMFAFSLWDADRERLLLARDRMGIKPLFLAQTGDKIGFASELTALLESGLEHGGLDQTAIRQYLLFGFVPETRTAFGNFSRVRPGERVVVTSGDVTRERYYTPSVTAEAPGIESAATELRDLVESSVERRLMSDVPLGAFLSGGIDSSIVVGTMADLMETPVQTFTVGFEQSLFDESWAARKVADYHDTDHTEFTVTPEEVRDTIPAVLDRLGEPFADPSLLPTYIVSRETSRDVKVALSGDGADELFAGYNKYRGEYYSQYYRRLPKVLRRDLISPAVNGLSASRAGRRGEFVRKAQKFLRGDVEHVADRHFEWNRIPTKAAERALHGDDPTATGRERMHEEHRSVATFLPESRHDDMSRLLAVDTRFGLPNQILHKADLASMYNSLEVRVPFLDTAVVEYALSLPSEYKITRSEQKRVLKKAFEDRLPDDIRNRDKQGFDMPIGEWFKNELADEFRDRIRAVETDCFDRGGVLDVFEEHRNGRQEHGKFLWSVYVFARWHDRMVESDVLEPAT